MFAREDAETGAQVKFGNCQVKRALMIPPTAVRSHTWCMAVACIKMEDKKREELLKIKVLYHIQVLFNQLILIVNLIKPFFRIQTPQVDSSRWEARLCQVRHQHQLPTQWTYPYHHNYQKVIQISNLEGIEFQAQMEGNL